MKRVRTSITRGLFAAAACSSFVLQPSAFAQTSQPAGPTLDASLGFDGVFKPDAWMPVYVRISDDRPRPATLELRTTRGRAGHVVDARIFTSAQPTTFTLYSPPVGVLDRVTLQLRDADGRLLRELDLSDAAAATPAAMGGPSFGVAGRAGVAERVVNQLVTDTQENVAAGAIEPALLPDRPIGFDAIDVLVLPELNTDTLDDDIEWAIVRWARAGGVVIAWPGAQAPAADSPLRALLPATIGEYAERTVLGKSLAVRTLSPTADGKHVRELSAGDGSIYERRVGLGQVVLASFDPSAVADHADDRLDLWRTLTSGQFKLLASERRSGGFDPLVAQARGEEQLKAQPPATSLRAWLIAGLLMSLAMGPGELALLAAARRHPRTSVTVLGLVGTVGFALGLIVYRPAVASAATDAIDVYVQTDDGACVRVSIADRLQVSDAGEKDDAVWLGGDRLDPTHQPAAELALGQRESGFDTSSDRLITLRGGSPATIRSIRFPGITDEAIQPDGSQRAPDGDAAAASVGRSETPIERIAASTDWAAILLDQSVARRLVQLQETERAAVRVSREMADDRTRYVVHVSRK